MDAHGALTNGMASLKSYPHQKLSQKKKEKRKRKYNCTVKGCDKPCCLGAYHRKDQYAEHICLCSNHFDPFGEKVKKPKPPIDNERGKVKSGASSALSSHKAIFFHDIPPELIRRIGKRYTGEIKDGHPIGGHLKYGVGPFNLNWRIGLDDPQYIADRFNHMFEHLLDFMENGNKEDDNLAAIGWCLGFLMEAERHAPEAFKSVFGQCKLFGKAAEELQNKMKELLNVRS